MAGIGVSFNVDASMDDVTILISGGWDIHPVVSTIVGSTPAGSAVDLLNQATSVINAPGVTAVTIPVLGGLSINLGFGWRRRSRQLLQDDEVRIAVVTFDALSLDIQIWNVDTDDNSLIDTQKGYIFSDNSPGAYFRVIVKASDIDSLNMISTINSIRLQSVDVSTTIECDNLILTDINSKSYYCDFLFSDVLDVIDLRKFKVFVVGNDIESNIFERITPGTTDIIDIRVDLDCDDIISDNSEIWQGDQAICTISVSYNALSGTLDGSEVFSISAFVDNNDLIASGNVDLEILDSDEFSFIFNDDDDMVTVTQTLVITVSDVDDDIIDEIFSVLIYVDGFGYDSEGPFTIVRNWCPDKCLYDPCSCDVVGDSEFCRICHPNGCDQCENGYFKKDYDYPCENCYDTFGEGCLSCQDFDGCGQCAPGYERVFEERCQLWTCKMHPLSTTTDDDNVIGCLDIPTCTNNPCDCSEALNCRVCNSGSGCGQCEDGYFKMSDSSQCVSCNSLFGENCLFCQNSNGCGQCGNGCNRVFNDICQYWECDC